MIHFACLQCGMKFKVKDEFAGRSTRCPTCKSPVQVPDLSRDELLDVLVRLREAGPGEDSYYIDLFDAHAELPEAACLLYWPPDKRAWRQSRRRLSEDRRESGNPVAALMVIEPNPRDPVAVTS